MIGDRPAMAPKAPNFPGVLDCLPVFPDNFPATAKAPRITIRSQQMKKVACQVTESFIPQTGTTREWPVLSGGPAQV